MSQIDRPRWSARTKTAIILLLLAAGVYLLYRFSSVLAPMVIAFILAYVLTPVCNLFLPRVGGRRGLATVFSYILFLGVLTILPVLIIPPLADQLDRLNLDIQRSFLAIEELLGNQFILMGRTFDARAIMEQAVGSFQVAFEPIFGQTLGLAVEIITSVVWIIFIFVVSFYLVKDGPALRAWMEQLVPAPYRHDYQVIREEIGNIWAAFFRGQLILAVVVAVIFTVIGLILGLPFALAMAVFAGLLEFLPSIGHGIWLAAASLLALFGGSTWLQVPNWVFMLIIIGLHLVYQQFDLNYLIPRIIGRSVHLPPLVVILGIVSGAVLAGVLGIFLAAPVIASLRVMGRYVYANLFDMNPFPESAAPPLPPPNPEWWRKLAPQKRKDNGV